jgi:hypothetical protein
MGRLLKRGRRTQHPNREATMSTSPLIPKDALDALEGGEPREAFQALRSVLDYPGQVAEPQRWHDAFDLFARVGAEIAGPEFAAVVRRVVEEPNNPQALYDLGYELIEQGLSGIAATALARANELSPGQPALLTELVAALERNRRSADACRYLRAAPELVESDFMCRYLLAFNAVLSGDLEEPRRLLPRLLDGAEDDHRFMAGRIQGMLLRADALHGVSALDHKDLRGWHFAITGGLLLHLSPYGIDEGMHGRYCYTQDSASRCLEGVRRVAVGLEAWGFVPPRVFALPDRNSAALALACGWMLSVPVEPWPDGGSEAQGLVVVYDLANVEESVVAALAEHRPGQALWSHAAGWTREPPFAADLTTYLYQFNVGPWDGGLRVNPETNSPEQAPPEVGTPEELGARIAEAEMEPGALDDLPALAALARAARTVPGEHGPGALRRDGRRRRQWEGSPVLSSYFFE